jgi:tetratricopeptide (TPR) repeat protein
MTELQHTLIDHNIRVAGSIPEEKSAAALGMAGNAAEAEKAFLEEVRLAPESKTNWHNLGMLYVNQSRWNVARNCFLRVHELDEKDGFAVCRIIELSALLKDVPSVEKWCAILASMLRSSKTEAGCIKAWKRAFGRSG